MNNSDRYKLIASFHGVPESKAELQWLVKSIVLEKQSAFKEMGAFEQTGASQFRDASENDPFVEEVDFYRDFEESRGWFEQWVNLEKEVSHLISNSQESELVGWSEDSRFLQFVGSNLISSASHHQDILDRVRSDFEIAREDVDKYGPESKDDHDDQWFVLQDALDASEKQLELMEIVLPHCWNSLRQFVKLAASRSCVHSDLISFIENDDQGGFISKALLIEKRNNSP